MPIKNYSSGQKAATSITNIQNLLAEHGANKVQIEYENAEPVCLSFSMWVGHQELYFRLEVNPEGMLRAMKNDKKVANNHCNIEQAKRTAWKNKVEWIHIQLSEIEAQQASLDQLLLGYAITPDGDTVYQKLLISNRLLEGKVDNE